MVTTAPLRRFGLVGDIHGDFESLALLIDYATDAHGPLDAVFAVGDVEALRDETDMSHVHGPAKYRKLGTFPDVVAGRLTLGAPLYFIGGNHEPWKALDEAGTGHWAPDVHFLGRAGRLNVRGLGVAYLSGIYSPAVSERAAVDRRDKTSPSNDRKVRTYWVREELARVHGPADLLLTHDWPAGIGVSRHGDPAGNDDLRDLTMRIRPQIHACGHMHHRLRATLGDTSVIALGHIRSGADAFAVIERDPDGVLRELTP